MFKSWPAAASSGAIAPDSTPERLGPSAAQRLLVAAAILLALAAAALLVDVPIARAMRASGLSGELGHLLSLSEGFGWGGSVALIILSAAVLDPRGWRVVPRLAIGAFGAGLFADAVKLVIARARPMRANLDGSAIDTFVGWFPAWRNGALDLAHNDKLQSFPSGHAATAAGLAVALAVLYPRGRWLFAALAILAALQRVEVQSHFLSDVLAGAALGCLVGAVCQADWRLGRWLLGLEKPTV